MKTIMRTVLTAFLIIPLLAIGASNSNGSDTVVIELESGSKIIIYTKSKEDLKALENYDINEMIADLNKSVDSSGTNYIELSDEDGNKYKREARIVYRDERNYDERTRDRSWDRDDDRRRKRRYYRRTRNVWNVELGTKNWLEDGNFPNDQDEEYAVQPWGSWYLALNSNYRTYIGGPLILQWGFGISTSQFRFEDSNIRVRKQNEMVDFYNADSTISPIRSKLRMSHLHFMMVPTLVLGDEGGPRYHRRSVRIGFGGYVGYRLGGSTRFVFTDTDGDREKDVESDDYYLNTIKYGIRAQFGYKAFDAFVNYDLNNVFANGRGPELNAFTFGVIF